MIIAIIPARGGSKGIPRKNIQPVGGKPLLAYSIEQALHTPQIERVYVSTDDDEIAHIARQYGAAVIQRPAGISGDTATSESALVHALDTIDVAVELVVFLQATSPLRQPDDIKNAIDQLQAEAADSLFSAYVQHGFLWRIAASEIVSVSYDYRDRRRRQELATDVIENGSIYVFKPEILRHHNNRLGGKITAYLMHPLDSFQVDEPSDVQTIEALLQIRYPKP